MNIYIKVFIFFFPYFSYPAFAYEKPGKVSSQCEINNYLSKVADWQIDHFTYQKNGNLHDYGIDAWTNAVLYVGMAEWAKLSGDTVIYNWLKNIGEENAWQIPSNFKRYPKYKLYHADELCVGQFYLEMYSIYNDSLMMASTRERIQWIMSNPPDADMSNKNKQSWTWCDALFMAPPVYARLARLSGDDSCLAFMDEHFKATYNYLYDKKEDLFFRDDSYFTKEEANGKKVFWGRGNGWVMAGIVNILKYLPQDSAYRSYYESLLKKLGKRLIKQQDKNGFWHASLLDAKSYPSPETSATALITYALAFGINNNILKGKDYLPAVQKGWNALVSVVDNDGKLGFVQPIGADPKEVTQEMTAVYGVGAFLLAGTEVYKLAERFEQ
ncbi:MAG: glycoside hydrolase family 88 protein [Prevotella sp.]|jgi:rhamnogalacturonyl hydrolase YesR|nr:glycoside hydrolase family 88 protein [Prevotella sp.]